MIKVTSTRDSKVTVDNTDFMKELSNSKEESKVAQVEEEKEEEEQYTVMEKIKPQEHSRRITN